MIKIGRNIVGTAKKMHTIPSSTFIWVDLELTGLDVDSNEIMEVACIPTTPDLQLKHPGISLQLHVSENALLKMDEWCTQHHAQSGLTDACRASTISLEDAEKILVDYIRQNSSPDDVRYMAGNTIYMDRRFIDKYMPLVSKLHHYRLIDVSTVATLGDYWHPNLMATVPPKRKAHRGLDDIQESIEQLRIYRNILFK